MTDEVTKALQQLRADVVAALVRIETNITALDQAAVDPRQPIAPVSLQKLQVAARDNSDIQKKIRERLEAEIRQIP